MIQEGFQYVIETHAVVMRGEVEHLAELSRGHYDAKCRAASGQGGFIYGWTNMFTGRGPGELIKIALTHEQLDLLAKITEAPGANAQLRREILGMFEQARAEAARMNGVQMTLLGPDNRKKQPKLVHRGPFYGNRFSDAHHQGRRERGLAAAWEEENERFDTFRELVASPTQAGLGEWHRERVVTQQMATDAALVVQFLGSSGGFDILREGLSQAGYRIVTEEFVNEANAQRS